MAEKEGGLIEGVLGAGETEEREAEESSSRADDVATVVMMDAARFDLELSNEAKEYLRDQRALIKLQVHHFDEERRLAIDAAKRKRFFDHLRMSFQVFLALVVTTVGVAAILMVWDAVHTHSVIIDPIEIAPNAASQVPGAKIISTGLLDVLVRIQAGIHTDADRRSLSNAWTNDISIEVAETGISIGQIERTLKARFGHDQHISGDLVLAEDDGLAFTVRGAGIMAKTFTGDKSKLDRLLTEAGEYIYSQSQPGLWMNYLYNNDRNDEAIRFASLSYRSLDPVEKPYVLVYWAGAIQTKGRGDLESIRTGLAMDQEAVRLKPDFWYGYSAVSFEFRNMGDLEGAIKVGERQIQAAGGRPGRSPEIMYRNYDQLVGDFYAYHNALVDDLNSYNGVGTVSVNNGDENYYVLLTDIAMHDVEESKLLIRMMQLDEKSNLNVTLFTYAKATSAVEAGDFNAAANEWDAVIALFHKLTLDPVDVATSICEAAVSYEKSGQSAKANAALLAAESATDGRYFDCVRFNGDVLELRGDWKGAQTWYAKAIRLAPSGPFGYNSYGVALLKHGDLNGAAEQFRLANQKGPHWADPLKAWGDVLIKQGHPAEALDKYDAALKYAHNWTQLKDARAAAIKAKS